MTNAADIASWMNGLTRWRESQRRINIMALHDIASDMFSENANIHMCYPFGDQHGASAWINSSYHALVTAIPDAERRDTIVISGQDQQDSRWVGCCGYYCGTFIAPFLDIPPTGQFVHMRYHEFYRITPNGIEEAHVIWDIVEVMKQANAWPMAPSLGREGLVPAPATLDGIKPMNSEQSGDDNLEIVIRMLNNLGQHPSQGGPDVMRLPEAWHEDLTWYGPSGIGTCRGLSGFRQWHQIPFLNAMPDRGLDNENITLHFFAQDNYVAVTGWPNMRQTLSGDGWLGIAPTNQKITLRSLDFWRIEDKKIKENWVLIDLLDIYAQLGVDVFARLKAFNTSRPTGSVVLPKERL
ncbi:polyketide cyclase [Enterovibrio norvegicus]|uniref:ester cyclase n=1 Tax=Enterovibrio norvegicus TaxID=188144 RepID=UPI0002F53E7D|nr:ester cyclase [Enterovibrio norvegicus]OEE65103.1 polyketide cyclase [Enterovibrio norvegicus]